MISHCANRACGLPFHYLRGGRLYRFELKAPHTPCSDVPNAICDSKPSHATIFFWLCERCSARYALRFNVREGVRLVSLVNHAQKASTAPVIAVGSSYVSFFLLFSQRLARPERSKDTHTTVHSYPCDKSHRSSCTRNVNYSCRMFVLRSEFAAGGKRVSA